MAATDVFMSALIAASRSLDLGEIVAAMGGTGAVAQRLGVTQRTVQRYITSASERRGASGRGQIRALREIAAARIARRDGVTFSYVAARIRFPSGGRKRANGQSDPDERPRQIVREIYMDGDAVGRVLEAQAGEQQPGEADAVLGAEFLAAYFESDVPLGEVTSVSAMELELGEP